MRKVIWILMAMAAVCATTVSMASDDDSVGPMSRAAARRIAVGTCANCHGPGGLSIVSKFPNLAAQPADYLAAQLQAFKSQTRGDPDALAFMWGIAGSLDNGQINALALYYSEKQPGARSAVDPSTRDRGRRIYEGALKAQGVPSCVTCHGARGEGVAAFPRLAGQQTPYFVSQMLAFKTKLRAFDVMQGVASHLSQDDVELLAEYVRSL